MLPTFFRGRRNWLIVPFVRTVQSWLNLNQNNRYFTWKFKSIFTRILPCRFFFIHGSVHRDSILIRSNEMQQYAGVYLLQNHSTCFGFLWHSSSGVHQTVTAASGTSHSVRATTFRQRGTVVKALCYKSEGRWFDPRWFHWNFSLTYSLRSHYGLGVDSTSNRNEYQEDFLGINAAGT